MPDLLCVAFVAPSLRRMRRKRTVLRNASRSVPTGENGTHLGLQFGVGPDAVIDAAVEGEAIALPNESVLSRLW